MNIQSYFKYCKYRFIFSGCQVSGFLGSVAVLAEIWSLAAVSFDRFKGIHYPLNNLKRTTNNQVGLYLQFHRYDYLLLLNIDLKHNESKIYISSFIKSKLMVLLIWSVAIILSCCPLLGWSQFVSEVSMKIR